MYVVKNELKNDFYKYALKESRHFKSKVTS